MQTPQANKERQYGKGVCNDVIRRVLGVFGGAVCGELDSEKRVVQDCAIHRICALVFVAAGEDRHIN